MQLLVNSTHLCRVSLDNEFNRLAVTACVSVEPSLQVSECSMHVLYTYMYMYMCVVDSILTQSSFFIENHDCSGCLSLPCMYIHSTYASVCSYYVFESVHCTIIAVHVIW